MQIDENSLDETSRDHLLLISHAGTFDDVNKGSTRIILGSTFDQLDDVKVKQLDEDANVFQWTGPIVVWAIEVGRNGVKGDRIIQCPGTEDDPNKVVATVNR